KARDLIDKARAISWQTAAFGDFQITFDGAGRYAFERTLPSGLFERVICDGKMLWHLYPELGLGAKRPVDRFHRAEFTALVPGTLPPAKDLARGADLRYVDEHTVAIVPHPSTAPKERSQKEPRNEVEVRLVFAEDGRLVERQVVRTPGKKVLFRETFAVG